MKEKRCIIEYTDLQGDPGDYVDASDQILKPEDRVTEADWKSPFCGLARKVQGDLGLVGVGRGSDEN